MKTRAIAFILSLLIVFPLTAQVDRSKPPKPGPAPEIKLGKYESFELSNGLKVFVVENHKLPRVAFSLVLDKDPILEGDQAGYTEAAGSLLRTGTKTRSKDELDKEIDFIGASLSTSSNGVFAMSLTEFTPKLLELMSDIVLNSDFKQDELDKIKKQMKSALASAKDEPGTIAAVVRDALVYGKKHPYGEHSTEETVDNITLKKCKEYYTKFFRPNISYLAVVGDINKKKAKTLVQKYFSSWEKKDVPRYEYKTPEPPLKTTVAIVDRPNSVQSVINVAYPVQLKAGDKDGISASVMNTILGGGVFRLFQNLREKHAYTYGAYSSLSKDELVGRFTASAEVRNTVTDSSVTQILFEMNRIRNEKVSSEELQTAKNYITGKFAIALERPQTIATFAVNTARYNLPKDYYANYLKNVAKVTEENVQNAADKFIKPDNSYIVVVGNKDQIEKGLASFGPENFYDRYGNKLDIAALDIPSGVTANSVIEKYVNAIGGKDNLDKVKDRITKMTATVKGMKINMTIYQKAPDLLKQEINFGAMTQSVIYNGSQGVMLVSGKKIDITGNELEKLKYESTIDLITNLDHYGIKLNLSGTEKLDGKNAYKVELILPSNTKWLQYYDPETGLKLKESKNINTPQGTFTQETYYSDYRNVGGVKYPFAVKQSVGPQQLDFTVDSIKVNTGINDDKFEIK